MSAALEMKERMRAEQAKRNREQMPNVAALMDEFRKDFPDCKLIWAQDLETGKSVGKREEPDPDRVFHIPPNYFPSRQVQTTKKGKR